MYLLARAKLDLMTTEASTCDVEPLVINERCAQADNAVRETCVKQRLHSQAHYQRKVHEIICSKTQGYGSLQHGSRACA